MVTLSTHQKAYLDWIAKTQMSGGDASSTASPNAPAQQAQGANGTANFVVIGGRVVDPNKTSHDFCHFGQQTSGVNLKYTDPEWRQHIHDILDMLGNIPVIGSLFNGINAGLYIAEGNAQDVVRETASRFRFSSIDGSLHHLFASVTPNAMRFPLVGIEDRHGNCIRIVYDDAGLPVAIHDSAGRVLQLDYVSVQVSDGESVTRLHRVMLGVQALVSYGYSGAGDLESVRNAQGQIVREFRYRNHMLIKHSQPGTLTARYEYDAYTPKGKVLCIGNNAGQRWQFRYLTDRTEMIDPLGHIESYLFNADNMLTGHVDGTGRLMKSEVDGQGNVLMRTDAGRRTLDLYGKTTSMTDAAGHRTEIMHDAKWQLPVFVSDEMGSATHYEYDARGELAATMDALGHRTEHVHDERGLLREIVDAHGNRQRFEHDAAGLMTAHFDCSQQPTRFTWDEWEHLRSVTNALGETIRHERDRAGRVLLTHYPDASRENYRYDVYGRLIEYIDRLGATTRWE